MREKNVVIDTNVIVSAFIAGGPPQKILKAWMKNRFAVVISRDLQEEINEVFKRKKFAGKFAHKKGILGKLFNKARVIEPGPLEGLLLRDQGDIFLLELAVASSAWALVTGDRELLEMGKIKKTKILNPEDFCKKFRL